MDENFNKVRRCGQIGEGENDLLSLQDVLDEQARLQADASAVLGASDPNNCTYPKGYLKRQALYACATCTPNGNAGICLACSYACHEGHDLYELYTKRFFCCDCGNEKFSGKECKLVKDKQMNSRNRYNQNFKGLYCSCSRPYPDPEDNVEDEMIQCVICEDWHHGRHLKTDPPEDFNEMICSECMSKFPFLWAYQVSSCQSEEIKKEETLDRDSSVDVGSSTPHTESSGVNNSIPVVKDEESKQQVPSALSPTITDKNTTESCVMKTGNVTLCEGTSQALDSPHGVKRGRDTSDEEQPIASKEPKLESSVSKCNENNEENGDVKKEECLLQSLKQRDYDIFEHATFWSDGWRLKLCKCQDCMEMYEDKGISFLADKSDTVQAYEEAGVKNEAQVPEEEENMYAGMHRVQQIEIARGVRDLKTDLNEFLQGFAREGKVVTETDIREFFQSLEEKRRRRMNLPQNNCR